MTDCGLCVMARHLFSKTLNIFVKTKQDFEEEIAKFWFSPSQFHISELFYLEIFLKLT